MRFWSKIDSFELDVTKMAVGEDTQLGLLRDKSEQLLPSQAVIGLA